LETFMNNTHVVQQQAQAQAQAQQQAHLHYPPVIGMYSSGNAHSDTNTTNNHNNKYFVDDVSLFNAASSMGEDTRVGTGHGTGTAAGGGGSVNTTLSYHTNSTHNDNDNYNYNDNDGATCISSVYQRSVLSAAASVYTSTSTNEYDPPLSLYTNTNTCATDAADVDVDSLREEDVAITTMMHHVAASVVDNNNNKVVANPPVAMLVSNEKLDDIRQCNNNNNNNAVDEVQNDDDSGMQDNNNHNTKNNNNNNNNRFKSGGIDVDGDDMDDDEPGTMRLTVVGLQQHDIKEAMKNGDQHVYGIVTKSAAAIAAPFPGMGVLYPVGEQQMRNAGPIDVDELDHEQGGDVDDDECIARKMMTLKLERQEELSSRRKNTNGLTGTGTGGESYLDRIDEDEMSVLSTKPFSAGTGVSPKKTQELLRREREKEREDRLRKAMVEAKERKRAQKLREAELIRQRNMQNEVQLRKEREAQAQRRLRLGDCDNNSRSTIGSIGDSNRESNNEMVNGMNGLSDAKGTDVPSYCVVCMEGERSHLAVPCMHFSFCEFCVKDLQTRNVTKCPVCNEDDVTFSKVFF